MTEQQQAAMRQALEAFEDLRDNHRIHYVNEIVDLRQALEQQPAGEPVAGVAQYVLDYISNGHKDVHTFVWNPKKKPAIPLVDLYTSPPASKPWVGMTDNEWFDFWDGCEFVDGESVFPEFLEIARAIEAKLRELNGGKA